MPRSEWTRPAFVCALYFILALVFCTPLFAQPHALGISDWDQHLFYHGAVIQSVIGYVRPPFWNPWYCGGNVLWQNPQVALLSPVYLLASVMSLALAMKVSILIHYWIGFIGMHLLLKRIIGLTHLPLIVYLASVFTLSGSLALHLNAGHSVFLPAFYLPLLLFFFLRSLRTGSTGDALLAGAILALTIYNGGLHIVPMAFVLVGAVGAFAALLGRRWRPLVLTALLGISGLAYAAPKFLPVVMFVTGKEFWDARTTTAHPDMMTPGMLLRAYVDPYQTRSLRADPVQRHGWFEYGNYIGSLAVITAISSGIWIFAARGLQDRSFGLCLALTGILVLTLSAGEFSRFAPASLATHLPLFASFRIPSRYTVAVALVAPMTVGWVLKSLAIDTTSGALRLLIGILCTVATAQLMAASRAQFNGVFPVAPLEHAFGLFGGPSTIQIDQTASAYGPNSPMLRALVDGRSFYHCYESLQLRHTSDTEHALVFSDGKARILETRFSPNRIQFSVANGPEASRVALNQNFASGWSSTAGPVTPDPVTGMPSVVLSAGQTGRFSFGFTPPGLLAGLIVFAAATIASAIWSRPRAFGIERLLRT